MEKDEKHMDEPDEIDILIEENPEFFAGYSNYDK